MSLHRTWRPVPEPPSVPPPPAESDPAMEREEGLEQCVQVGFRAHSDEFLLSRFFFVRRRRIFLPIFASVTHSSGRSSLHESPHLFRMRMRIMHQVSGIVLESKK